MKNLILYNPWFELLCRWVLACVFLWACVHKILHPDAFAKIIYGYKILPGFSINLLAITLPFFELFSALALLLGVWPRSAIIVINGMLLVFIAAITFNLIRGLQFDCGCFSVHQAGVYSDPRELLVRDILYFLMGLAVLFHRGARKFSLKDSGALFV